MKNLLILGGDCGLGKCILTKFKATQTWRSLNVDVLNEGNIADQYIKLKKFRMENDLKENIEKFSEKASVHCMISVASMYLNSSYKGGELEDKAYYLESFALDPFGLMNELTPDFLAPKGLCVQFGPRNIFDRNKEGIFLYATMRSNIKFMSNTLAEAISQDTQDRTNFLIFLEGMKEEVLGKPGFEDTDLAKRLADLVLDWANGVDTPKNGAVRRLRDFDGQFQLGPDIQKLINCVLKRIRFNSSYLLNN